MQLCNKNFFTEQKASEVRVVWMGFFGPENLGSQASTKPRKKPKLNKKSQKPEENKRSAEVNSKKERRKTVEENAIVLKKKMEARPGELKAFFEAYRNVPIEDGAGPGRDIAFMKAMGLNFKDPELSKSYIRAANAIACSILRDKKVPVERGFSGELTPEIIKNLERFFFLNPDSLLQSIPKEREKIDNEVADHTTFQKELRAQDPEVIYQIYRKVAEEDENRSEGLDANLFFEVLESVIQSNPERFDFESREGWVKAFKNTGLNEERIRQLGLMPEVEVLEPAVPKKSKPSTESAEAIFAQRAESDRELAINNRERALQDLGPEGGKPSTWWLYIDNLEGPDRAYKNYVKAYQVLEEKGPVDFKNEYDAYIDAYKEAKQSVNDYFEKQKKIIDDSERDYKNGLNALLEQYMLPKNLPIENYMSSDPNTNSQQFSKDYEAAPSSLRNRVKILKLLEGFQVEGIDFPIKTKRDLSRFTPGNNGDERRLNAERIWSAIRRMGVTDPGRAITESLYVSNIREFGPKHSRLFERIQRRRRDQLLGREPQKLS